MTARDNKAPGSIVEFRWTRQPYYMHAITATPWHRSYHIRSSLQIGRFVVSSVEAI